MASTYSPLKIELMATGEKNNQWGDITNTNLGTALEEAITGSADVTFASGNVTISLTDTNASQTARNLRLNLIGTTAGARDLIVPAIEKLYYIYNGTTGGDTITVKNATGTGIAVPNGKGMVVFNNATNVVDGITHLTSLSLGSALPVTSGGTGTTTSTGTGSVVLNNTPTLIAPLLGTPTSGVLTNATGLPISTGVSGLGTGVATFLATPSSSNLAAAVTDETGSGALVFATSPTLVTPALGTPASGVMTNVTGLPISTGVSGLGTGVATFLGTPSSANLAAAVTDETGSGALVFANTPTLIAPLLGTPTSGVMTNVTGLPLTTGVTGTLAVTNGGTGRATSTTAYGLIAAGTTATGAHQTLATGATTEILVGGGASALPVWTTATGSGAPVRQTSPSLVTPVLGTPSSGTLTSCTGLPISTGVSGLGTGVATFLGTPSSANLLAAVTDETGTGSLVFATSPTLVTPVLGTPSSGTLTSCTGLPISTGVSGLGTGVATFLGTPSSANLLAAVTDETGTGSLVFATSPTLVTPVLGTPSSGTLTSCTGLPISTGVSDLGTGVATFLGTPSSANLLAAVTDETGTGSLVFATSPTLVTPVLGTPSSGTLTSCTGLPIIAGTTGTLSVARGGTGATTLTSNGVIYGSGTSAVGVTAAGATGEVLIGNTGLPPSWGAPPAAGVTTIGFGSTGLTPSAATGGVVTVAGTLAVANGGTGRATSTTAYGLIAAGTTATGAHQTLATGATTEILVGGGASALPVWTTATGSGAPVRATSPSLVTPVLGTPSSGTLTSCTGLPISTGVSGLAANVATFLATPSSANLLAAVTDETGTGSLVFATSPSLVTPVLGTPSSGTLTSCTGLPISTGVSGLGTGVATFLASQLTATASAATLVTTAVNEAVEVTIASAGTTDLAAAAGNSIIITGTTTITALGTTTSGVIRRVRFAAAAVLTLTHNATSLILPTGANITTAAGDTAEFMSLGSGNWVCTRYDRVSGAALVGVTSISFGSTGLTPSTATSGVVTVAGTLAVANGGTGRATSTTAYGLIAAGTTATGAHQTLSAGATTTILVGGGASALPVWTTATGSGAPVRATSPSLVTPVLGTPSSGTLTSCTGLPISTGVSGLGTGVATFLATPSSANLLAAVTDETGTGSLVFATSPTLVTPTLGNASATTIATGTGTAAAAGYAFTGDLDTGFFSPAINTLCATVGGGEGFRLTSTGLAIAEGNVATQSITLYKSGSTENGFNVGNSNTGIGGGFFGVNTAGGVEIRSITINTVALFTNGVSRMHINSSGNVGFGTTDQFGTGTRVLGIANATVNPSTNPTGGGVLYADAGALKWRGSSGTVTTIANA